MKKKVGADSLVRSKALLADVDAACPCRQCHYDYDVMALHQRPGGVICPFKTQPEKRCGRRAAWERWQEWTLHILEVRRNDDDIRIG